MNKWYLLLFAPWLILPVVQVEIIVGIEVEEALEETLEEAQVAAVETVPMGALPLLMAKAVTNNLLMLLQPITRMVQLHKVGTVQEEAHGAEVHQVVATLIALTNNLVSASTTLKVVIVILLSLFKTIFSYSQALKIYNK